MFVVKGGELRAGSERPCKSKPNEREASHDFVRGDSPLPKEIIPD